MLGSIKYNFRHLLDFSGRDAQPTFWWFVLFVFLLNVAVSVVLIVPFIANLISSMMVAAQTGDQASIQTAMAVQTGEMMGSMVWLGVVTTLVYVALLAAGFTRRLHDSNLSGLWGLLPLGLQAAATWYTTTRIGELKAMMAQMMSTTDPQAAMAAQSQMSAQSLIGWLPIIAVVVLGIRKSTDGPNRYGEAPVRV
jgi:uncharacterized membrane protein YhaH (DUF805 family)